MFAKCLEEETIIIEVATKFYSGQDYIVYVSGYDAILKTFIINQNYPPKTYEKNDKNIMCYKRTKEKNIIDIYSLNKRVYIKIYCY